MTPWAKQRITELVKAVDVVGRADGVTVDGYFGGA